MKLEPLASLLYIKFQAYIVLGQNVSFNEMMVPFTRRSKHMLKIKNKLVKEDFKMGVNMATSGVDLSCLAKAHHFHF